MSRSAAACAVAAGYVAGFVLLFRGVRELCFGGAALSALAAGVRDVLLGLAVWALLAVIVRRRQEVR